MSYADWPLRKAFLLHGEIKDFPIADTGDVETYLDIDRDKLASALDKICDEVNYYFPNDEDRYKVTVTITIDKQDDWEHGKRVIEV